MKSNLKMLENLTANLIILDLDREKKKKKIWSSSIPNVSKCLPFDCIFDSTFNAHNLIFSEVSNDLNVPFV